LGIYKKDRGLLNHEMEIKNKAEEAVPMLAWQQCGVGNVISTDCARILRN